MGYCQDFVQRYDMSVVVSVEARLYADGCMELQYDRIPGEAHRAAAKIGIETRTGQLDLQHEHKNSILDKGGKWQKNEARCSRHLVFVSG